MTLDVDLALSNDAPDQARDLSIASAEHSCVVLQTLRQAVAVDVHFGTTDHTWSATISQEELQSLGMRQTFGRGTEVTRWYSPRGRVNCPSKPILSRSRSRSHLRIRTHLQEGRCNLHGSRT
jgi:hypothetical protein